MTSTLRDGRGCLDRSNFADIQVINVGQGGGRVHTVLFFKIYAVEIGHQFRVRGIIRIGQDYISSEYEQVPTGAF